MPSTRTYLRSWAAGQISPMMVGRIDSQQFQTGLLECRNWLNTPQGPIRVRPGFADIAGTKSNQRVRLVTFNAGPDDQLLVEVGVGYLRFHRGGVTLGPGSVLAHQGNVAATFVAASSTINVVNTLEVGNWVEFNGGTLPPNVLADTPYYVATQTPTAITIAEGPGEPTITWTGGPFASTLRRRYYLGDLAAAGGVNYYCVASHVNIAPPSGGIWYAMPAGILEVPGPYTTDHMRDLTYAQKNDLIRFSHRNEQMWELRRYSDTRWTMTAFSGAPGLLAPTGLELVAMNQGGLVVTAISNVNPAVLTTSGNHGLVPNDPVYLRDVNSNMQDFPFSDGFYSVAVGSGSTLQLKQFDGTAAISGAGRVAATYARLEYFPRTDDGKVFYTVTVVGNRDNESEQAAPLSVLLPLGEPGVAALILWDGVENAVSYRVYRRERGLYSKIGEVLASEERKSLACGFSLGANPLYLTGFGLDIFTEGMPVRLKVSPGGTLPSGGVGLSLNTTYYARRPRYNWLQLSLTPDGDPISGVGMVAGTGTYTVEERWHLRDPNYLIPDGAATPPKRDGVLESAGDWPAANVWHEGRAWFGGQTNEPQRLLATRSNTDNDLAFHLPQVATDRIDWEIATLAYADIRHLVPLGRLLVLTGSCEVAVASQEGQAISPASIMTVAQSYVGASRVRPQVVAGVCVWNAAAGSHIWATEYDGGGARYKPVNLSLRAMDLFDGHTMLASAQTQEPYPVHYWLRDDGVLLGCTFIPSEAVAGWHQFTTSGGTIEDIAVVREGGEDRLYVQTARPVTSGTVRRIERMGSWFWDELADWNGMDASRTFTSPGATLTGLTHLIGQTVRIVADGTEHPERTVSVTGTVSLNASTYTTVHVGKAVTAVARTLPVALQIEAWAQGRTLNVGAMVLRLDRTTGLEIGPETDQLVLVRPSDRATPAEFSGPADTRQRGAWEIGGPVVLYQDRGFPSTVVAATMTVAIGD